MSQNRERGFASLLVCAVAAIVLGGAFYFINKSNNDSKFTLDTTNLPAQVFQSTQTDAVIDTGDDETDSTTPATNDGLALATANTVANSKILSAPQAKKLAVQTTPEVSLPAEKTTTAQIMTVTEAVSEPTLFIEKGVQPKNSLLLADARRVPFTVIELTAKGGDITVDSLLLERGGLASDRIFTEVGVIDMSIERALNSKHQYLMKDSFTINDGDTQEIVLYGNVKDIDSLLEYDGQVASLSLVNIETSAKISGTLPITGAMHTVNSNLVIGSLELTTSGLDPGVNRSIDVNTHDNIFSAVKINAGSVEPLLLKSFAWTQNGSASSNDFENVKTCVVQKSNTTCVDATTDDGRYYYSSFDNDVRIEKGESAEVYVKGDVLTTGANRTIDFDIGSSYDVSAFGLTYQNYFYTYGGELEGAQPEGTYSITESPFYNGFAHTIVTGSISSIR